MLPAYALCEQALRIDNRNVRALVILALRLVVRVFNLQSVYPQADGVRADELISRALAVDSNNYLDHYVRSVFLAAIVEAERALALNPSFVPAYLSLWIASSGRCANWAAGRQKRPMNTRMRRCGSVPTTPLSMNISAKRGSGYSPCRRGRPLRSVWASAPSRRCLCERSLPRLSNQAGIRAWWRIGRHLQGRPSHLIGS